jgi:hypothetical protein
MPQARVADDDTQPLALVGHGDRRRVRVPDRFGEANRQLDVRDS